MSAVWALQGVVPHGKKEKLTPGVEIKENPVFGFWVAKIGLGINVESISVPMVNGGFHLFKRGTDAFFQFI